MKTQYPILPDKPTAAEIEDYLREITRLRQTEDVPDFTNLPNIYLRGRITTRIPSSSADVIATDVEGDVVFNGLYMYRLTLISTNLVWTRTEMAPW